MRAVLVAIVVLFCAAVAVTQMGGGADNSSGGTCMAGDPHGPGCNPHPGQILGHCVRLQGDGWWHSSCDVPGAVDEASNPAPNGASGDMGAQAFGDALSRDEIRQLWVQHGGDPAEGNMAVAIAEAESAGRAASVNHNTDGTIDRGLFQINSIHGSQSTFYLGANVDAAVAISNHGHDWSAWSSYKSGAYAKYM